MKAPKIMCDNVRQFAVSVFSTEPMSLIASVDIGTAAFLTVTGFSGVDGGRGAPRSGATNHGPVKKSIPRYGRSVSLERCRRFRDGYRQRRNVSAVMRRTPTVIIRISVAPKSLMVCKGTSQVPPTSQDASKYARMGEIMKVETYEAQKAQ